MDKEALNLLFDNNPAPYDFPVPADHDPACQDHNPVMEAEGPPPDRMGDMGVVEEIEEDIAHSHLESEDDDASMDLDQVNPAMPVVDGLPTLAIHQNPLVGIADWPGDEWLWQAGSNNGGLDEALEGLSLSNISNELAGHAGQEPKFIELDGPLGLDPNQEPEIDDGELWELMQDLLGNLAKEEWLDLYHHNLTHQDRATLWFLASRLRSHFSCATYNDLCPNAFKELSLSSDFVAWRRLKILSGLESRVYNCCMNSCICYLGKHQVLDECPYCHEPQYKAAGNPRRTFNYTPLIPQLQGLFQDPALIKNMRHCTRHKVWRAANPGMLEDVFDGELYRRLWRTQVRQGDNYKYFDLPDNLALGLGTDGFSMFKRRRKGELTAWPLIIVNYNLHPII